MEKKPNCSKTFQGQSETNPISPNRIEVGQKELIPNLCQMEIQNLEGCHPKMYRSVYRHGVLSSLQGKIPKGVVMDIPAHVSLSYGPKLFISLLWLRCFCGSLPCRKLGRTPCLHTVLSFCMPFGSQEKWNKAPISPVLRIWDVYPGSCIQIFPHPRSQEKLCIKSIFLQTLEYKICEYDLCEYDLWEYNLQ